MKCATSVQHVQILNQNERSPWGKIFYCFEQLFNTHTHTHHPARSPGTFHEINSYNVTYQQTASVLCPWKCKNENHSR